jgi:hypothetical protein
VTVPFSGFTDRIVSPAASDHRKPSTGARFTGDPRREAEYWQSHGDAARH